MWRLVSDRVASGLSPYGVTSFVHARLGSLRGYQGRSPVSDPNLLLMYQWCPGVTWLEWRSDRWVLGPLRGNSPQRLALIHSAVFLPGLPSPLEPMRFEPRRQGGRNCVVGDCRRYLDSAAVVGVVGALELPTTPLDSGVLDRGFAVGGHRSTDVSSVRGLIDIKMDAWRVAGTSRTRGWTGRSPSCTGFDTYPCEKIISR